MDGPRKMRKSRISEEVSEEAKTCPPCQVSSALRQDSAPHRQIFPASDKLRPLIKTKQRVYNFFFSSSFHISIVFFYKFDSTTCSGKGTKSERVDFVVGVGKRILKLVMVYE